MPKESKSKQHIKSAINKDTEPIINNPHKKREHPLAQYVTQRDIPFADHSSPINKKQWESEEDRKQVEKMERKLFHCLSDINHPLAESERMALGECPECAFDTYMSSVMDPKLYKRKEFNISRTDRYAETVDIKNIEYKFNYPNFPSFGDISWAKGYVVIDEEDELEALENKGATIGNESEILLRCIAKKLIISFDTQTDVYYVELDNWIQSLSEDKLSWLIKTKKGVISWGLIPISCFATSKENLYN